MYDFLRKSYHTLKEMHNNKFINYLDLPRTLYNNIGTDYTLLSHTAFRERKTSDTIFLLGSGPSLNLVSEEQWGHIRDRNSFGLNFSFLKPHIPTFYQPSYHRAELGRALFRSEFAARRNSYSDVIWMLSTKAKRRLVVPWLLPELFPENALIYEYDLPEALVIPEKTPFTDRHFERTVFYRGTMTLSLNFAIELAYKKIVLLGVDPETWEEFFCDYPAMAEYVDQHRQMAVKDEMKFESMIPKQGKANPIDDYYSALAEYLLRAKSIELFIGFGACSLSSRLPVYFKS